MQLYNTSEKTKIEIFTTPAELRRLADKMEELDKQTQYSTSANLTAAIWSSTDSRTEVRFVVEQQRCQSSDQSEDNSTD